MSSNPLLGLLFHWIGGLSSASFYIPYRGVKNWAWETYWLVGGFFSWIIAPWLLALLMTEDLPAVLLQTPLSTLFWTYFFGALWGVGGLTFGLTMRYLGMSLGMAVALGYCAVFGTLIPPIFAGEFGSKILGTRSGIIILTGVGICLLGIAAAGFAGMTKEREMPEAEKRKAIKEFNFKKGLLTGTFSGILSACFSFGLAAGDPIKALTLGHGTTQLWQGLPVLVVVLLGGFTANFIWCLFLNVQNRSLGQYLSARPVSGAELAPPLPNRLGLNYLLCALAGILWYLQFFFYSMGESQMGHFKFSSWTLHMASIIIFSSLWGLALKEWKGASRRAMNFLFLSLFVLVLSTVIVGYGNYVAMFSLKLSDTP